MNQKNVKKEEKVSFLEFEKNKTKNEQKNDSNLPSVLDLCDVTNNRFFFGAMFSYNEKSKKRICKKCLNQKTENKICSETQEKPEPMFLGKKKKICVYIT